MRTLADTALALVSSGRGILAADESVRTMSQRLEGENIPATEENRRLYRELLVSTPGLSDLVSGVILCDETLRQHASVGDIEMPFAEACHRWGILPGIKVDTGTSALAGAPGALVTEGLDGLRGRLAEYAAMGAAFAKWRAVIDVTAATDHALSANAHALARYAALCQEQQIVPIVEPEVLMDGGHSIERCEDVTNAVLAEVFHQLGLHRIHLEGMVLKPNMVISGKKAANRAGPEQVAEATLRTLRRHVPSAVPGIAFLSGGQSSPEATLHLSLMNKLGPLPWNLTFSYGRALQETALKAWGGKPATYAAGQKEFAKRARLNSLATTGRYSAAQEADAA